MENPKKKIYDGSLPKDFTDLMKKLMKIAEKKGLEIKEIELMKFAEKKGSEIKEIVEKIKGKTSKQSLEKQLTLVAGYDKKAKEYLTLQLILDKEIELDLFSLSLRKRAEISIQRIEEKDDFKRVSLRYGPIDRERALKEIGGKKSGKKIKKPSKLGKDLIDLECREIHFAFEKARKLKEVN